MFECLQLWIPEVVHVIKHSSTQQSGLLYGFQQKKNFAKIFFRISQTFSRNFFWSMHLRSFLF